MGAELRDHRRPPPGLARVQADVQRTVDAGEVRLSESSPSATRFRRAGRGRVEVITFKPLSKNPGALQSCVFRRRKTPGFTGFCGKAPPGGGRQAACSASRCALQGQRLGAVRLRDAGVADQHVSQTAVCDTPEKAPPGARRRVSYPVSDSMFCRRRANEHGTENRADTPAAGRPCFPFRNVVKTWFHGTTERAAQLSYVQGIAPGCWIGTGGECCGVMGHDSLDCFLERWRYLWILEIVSSAIEGDVKAQLFREAVNLRRSQ